MAGTLNVGTISDGTNNSTPELLAKGTAKAWVNFNGTGTVAIRASYNVSSITDNGVGDYTVNMTNALADANYCCSFGTNQLVLGGYGFGVNVRNDTAATTSFRINSWDANSLEDLSLISISVFR